MKQQSDSLFFQSQLYVAVLNEPLTILQFLENDENENQRQSSHQDKLEISNKSERKENSNKSRLQLQQSSLQYSCYLKVQNVYFQIDSTQRNKEKSLWIWLGEQSTVNQSHMRSFRISFKQIQKQFGVHLSQITQRTGPKWIIKKLKPAEANDYKEFHRPRLVKDFLSQEKKTRQTASKSYRRRIDKNYQEQKQSLNGISIFDPNFQINSQQYNL